MSFQKRIYAIVLMLLLADSSFARPAVAQTDNAKTMPDPNGYKVLIQATKAFKKSPGRASDLLTIRPDIPKVTPAERQEFIDTKAAALDLARTTLVMEYCDPKPHTAETLYPELADFRELARAFSLEADSYDDRKQPTRAVSSCLDSIEMGVKITHGGNLIQRLVGLACEGIGQKGLWNRVPTMDSATVRMALRRLERCDSKRLPLSQTWRDEKTSLLASLKARLLEAKNMPLPPTSSEAPSSPRLTDAMITDAQERQKVYYDALIAAADHPYIEKIEEKISTYYTMGDGKVAPDDGHLPVVLLPVASDAHLREDAVRAQNALLIVALALRSYLADHNDYPTDLAALTGGEKPYLSRLPLDPFAPSLPVRYHRVSTTRYLLYSVGPDGINEYGKPLYRNENVSTLPPELRSPLEQRPRPIQIPTRDCRGDIVVGVNVGPASLAPPTP